MTTRMADLVPIVFRGSKFPSPLPSRIRAAPVVTFPFQQKLPLLSVREVLFFPPLPFPRGFFSPVIKLVSPV